MIKHTRSPRGSRALEWRYFHMTAAERLLRYVQFDTQSNEFSDTCPSTDKQKVLALTWLRR